MSYAVTKLVREARLPVTMTHRPVAKLVLLALADRCDQDGRNAWPSLDTIRAESEIASEKTARAHLQALQRHGLIHEQRRPSQHRPRVWRLDLDAIRALNPEGQPDTPLDDASDADSGEQSDGPEGQRSNPEGQFSASEGQAVPPDPVPLNGPLNGTQNKDRTSAAPRFTMQAKEPNGKNFFIIRKIAIDCLIDYLKATGERPSPGDLVESVKQRCAELRVDYGNQAGVSHDVVHRACASAEFEVFVKRKLGIPTADQRRGQRP
jgi:hypothetical protein